MSSSNAIYAEQANDLVPARGQLYATMSSSSNNNPWLTVAAVVSCFVIFGAIPFGAYWCFERRRHRRRQRYLGEEAGLQLRSRFSADGSDAVFLPPPSLSSTQNGRMDEVQKREKEPLDEEVESDLLNYIVCKGVEAVEYSGEDSPPHRIQFDETAKQFHRPSMALPYPSSPLSSSGAGFFGREGDANPSPTSLDKQAQLRILQRIREEGEPEQLPGLPIEVRVRPRRRWPKKKVVLMAPEMRRIELQFHEDAHIPDAEPPPLTAEERAKLEAKLVRVASPLVYGRADYKKAKQGPKRSVRSPSTVRRAYKTPPRSSSSTPDTLHRSFISLTEARLKALSPEGSLCAFTGSFPSPPCSVASGHSAHRGLYRYTKGSSSSGGAPEASAEKTIKPYSSQEIPNLRQSVGDRGSSGGSGVVREPSIPAAQQVFSAVGNAPPPVFESSDDSMMGDEDWGDEEEGEYEEEEALIHPAHDTDHVASDYLPAPTEIVTQAEEPLA